MKILSRLLFCLIILIGTVCSISAQNAAKNWVFGNRARIDFNSGSPVASTVPEGTMSTPEGSSSISDSNGNLLFYTDGLKVWNRNHSQMPNGKNLKGGASSTQSALIVPCGCNRYFIFTTGEIQQKFRNGFRYSVVDMSADGGFGDVISTKNLMPFASEKVAAISDGNRGFWVVAHDIQNSQTGVVGNGFYSYHIRPGSDCTLNLQPEVISNVGAIYPVQSYYGIGQMKISPDGTRLAVAVYGPNGFLELFQFDTLTGRVSNLPIGSVRSAPTNNLDGFYGVEFSPDSSKLYATTIQGESLIYRYDIAGDVISNTLTPTHSRVMRSRDYYVGALQLGPDERIYIASAAGAYTGNNYVFVLNVPNDPPAGGWVDLPPKVFLGPGSQSRLGLPSMVGGNFSCEQPRCDQVMQTSFSTPDLSLSGRTFDVYNLKIPVSNICLIDIDIRDSGNDQPPKLWSAGGLKVNGMPRLVPEWWKSPYVTIPNGMHTVIAGLPNANAPAVSFNLGLDYSGTFTGKVKLTIRHCDGTFCEWVSDDWTPEPPE